MSGSLKTILRGSTSRVNLPNAQSNDCGRSPTNDGNGNAASCDLSSGSLNAPPRLWQLPYTKLSPWMAPQWGQTPARYSHPIDFEYFGRTPQFTSSKRRNAWDNSPALSTPLQETIRQRYPSRPASSRNRPVCIGLISALPAGHRPHAAYQGHLVERPYLRSVVRARHQPRHRLPRVHRPYLHAHDPFPFLHGSFTDDIIPSISFASPTTVRNINWNIMFQLIFPVVGSFFSLSLRSPMVMLHFPGVVLLLGFF